MLLNLSCDSHLSFWVGVGKYSVGCVDISLGGPFYSVPHKLSSLLIPPMPHNNPNSGDTCKHCTGKGNVTISKPHQLNSYIPFDSR